ncbi:AAA family ATPase [Massilia violaceinigra]|uniref:AAA family ATPase n=1 Tax=Massilia violaceinigra TaxID=2045208 RepID=A0ABY4AA82_9BURK|nr:AAA family ATPase [Massilia violaceinigra]UOD31714.1 AAA family ATPase [Massilia violaceinigra]
MLTRLKVSGFKSMEAAEVRFGPFTCIAGANGSGKSNLFDAILFLKHLADWPFVEAATRIRNSDRQRASLAALFTRSASGQADLIEFDADLLVGATVKDDFGRVARPKVSFLHYRLGLRYVAASGERPEAIALAYESLDFVPKGEARRRLGFPLSQAFFDSVYLGTSRSDFIYMDAHDPAMVRVRQDGAGAGQPISIPLATAERTILSNINTIDRPTALAARREMQSWSSLHLESSALRQPDDFMAASTVSPSGAHMPATLDRLKKCDAVSSQLARLLPDVKRLSVDVDERRQIKTLFLELVGGVRHEARALSDGTLRFLALAIIGADPQAGGLLCIEEPENGIHPSRIASLLHLLTTMGCDTGEAVGPDNPLRQVIVATHSPLFVQKLPLGDVIVARTYKREGAPLSLFSPVIGTWRDKTGTPLQNDAPVTVAALLDYLDGGPENEHKTDSQAVLQAYRQQLDLAVK